VSSSQARIVTAGGGAIALANAPVSFGVWGAYQGPPGVPGIAVLGAIAAAGYAGSELGPPGYLGTETESAHGFAEHGLQFAGVYVGLHLRGPGGLSPQEREVLERVCRTGRLVQQRAEEAGAPQAGLPLGPIVLADEGSDTLRDHPARDPADRRLALDDAAWRDAAVTISAAQALVTEYGLTTSFHPHLVTHVEARWEVERLLETTEVGITLDTGHLLLAGADPVQCLRDWGDRVDHVHLKDVRLDVLERARRDGRQRIDNWWGSACVPFGSGDVDLRGVVETLATSTYRGWVVVEQDHTPTAADSLEALTAQQGANRDWLLQTLAKVRTR
jgi:inosose dehydratase